MASVCTNCARTRLRKALWKEVHAPSCNYLRVSNRAVSWHLRTRTSDTFQGMKWVESGTNSRSMSTAIGRSARTDNSLAAMLKGDNKLMGANELPSEAVVLDYLEACEKLARSVADKPQPSSAKAARSGNSTPASSLLSLDEQSADEGLIKPETKELLSSSKRERRKKISLAAYNVITDPNVFITAKILEKYASIQSMLGMPETLGEVFQLYANKPVPRPKTSPVQYTIPDPNKLASAVPLATAIMALDSAIEAKNLGLCMDIIKTSVCTTAFKRAKLLRKAGIPAAAAALAPFAAYTLASQLSVFQDTMSSEMATNIAFAGILSYLGFTAMIGMVAITTANDQMERVSWATGTPLRERWLREEERAMVDRVAEAWGFKEKSKRGEEEGKEWEALREWIGLRGMVLDKVALMEGME